jgi:hypothetical protein
MSRSPADLIRDDQLRQESERLTREVIAHASCPISGQVQTSLGYLVSQFGRRSDLPEGALLCKMLPEVVRNLAALGLHEPVLLIARRMCNEHSNRSCLPDRRRTYREPREIRLCGG